MEETTGAAFSATKRFLLKVVTAVKVDDEVDEIYIDVVCNFRAKEANSPHSGRLPFNWE